jgi:hypothetical protein
MINYLARRMNPSPHALLMPVEVLLYGEDRILSDLQARPADYVLLVHKDTSEFGAAFFGRDYGRRITTWIAANYRPVVRIGAPPLRDDRFGMLLLQRSVAGP